MLSDGTRRCFEHILVDDCHDPDCEIHMIDVGLAEGTVTPDQYMFWLAGVSISRPRDEAVRQAAFADAREFLARYSPTD